jgi:hypothetical protein
MNAELSVICGARLERERIQRAAKLRADEIRCLEYTLENKNRAKDVYELYALGKISEAVAIIEAAHGSNKVKDNAPLLQPRRALLQALLEKKLRLGP